MLLLLANKRIFIGVFQQRSVVNFNLLRNILGNSLIACFYLSIFGMSKNNCPNLVVVL